MDPLRSTSETRVVVIQVIPSLYVDHRTLIPPQWQSCASMSCPPAARHSEVIDPLLAFSREKKKKKTSVYDSFTFAAFPQWCKQQRGRQRREGEGGRRGLRLLLGKMMRRLFLEPADRRKGGGGGGDLLNLRGGEGGSRFLTHPGIFSGSAASSIL